MAINNKSKKTSEPAQDLSRRRGILTENIRCAISKYGYIELDLPLYEHYDLLKETAFNFSEENVISFIDRNTGKTLVLRPDFTPQVCRAVTGYMSDYPLPLRISYKGIVFRSGHNTEKYQIGWELFGGSELCGDIEMILISTSVLKSINLNGYSFVVGDAMFLQRLLSLTGDLAQPLKIAISGKKLHDIKELVENSSIDEKIKKLLYLLPLSFGSRDVIEELKKVSSFDEILLSRVEYIEELFNNLIKLGIDENVLVFDGAETKGLDYYTGVNFDIVHKNSGSSLGSGGRYDNLMLKFGKNISACGMALHIEELMEFDLCGDNGQIFDYLVVGWDNLNKAEELRKTGNSVFFVANLDNIEKYKKVYNFKNIIN